MSLRTKLADVTRNDSVSNRLRSRRFKLFEELCSTLSRPLTIVDVGGTASFWAQRGWAGSNDVQITLVNVYQEPQDYENIASVVGDATDLKQFGPRSFDIAFSNSVIEHLFTFEKQLLMGREIQ